VSRLRFLDSSLAELEQSHLLRTPRSRADLPRGAIWLCSNDYLGFAERDLETTGPGGAGASALVWGYGPDHEAAERALATYTGVEACLLFSSGYAANVGAVSALAGRGDLVVSDALNHASLIDGCRLSGARVVVTPHLDLDAVASALRGSTARRRFVVTESYFSMDGDGPDLAALASICAEEDAALVVDEAHAIGVLGPRGRGRCAAAGVVPDVMIGTLGKSFGLAGAFVGGRQTLRTWLWNRARSFVFSTAVSPALARSVEARVAEVEAAEAPRAHLAALGEELRAHLTMSTGVRPGGFGPIIPVPVASAAVALSASARLLREGWVVQPMRPPTVPPGTSRLRITVRSTLTLSDVARAAVAIADAVGEARGAPVHPSSKPTTVAVVGTGTEVGKTHVATSLVALLRGRGQRVSGRKPIESGVAGGVGADQLALQQAGGEVPSSPAPYRFEAPVSPHLAARREGRAVDVKVAASWAVEGDADVVIVESAGGLMSPLGPGVTNLDLVREVAPAIVLLVCSDRLGVLHDVTACRWALESIGLWRRTVVCINGSTHPDASSGTNADELRSLLGIPVCAWPRGPGVEAAAETWELSASVGRVA
jgi:8-amino-7-oxononanoate synthase